MFGIDNEEANIEVIWMEDNADMKWKLLRIPIEQKQSEA